MATIIREEEQEEQSRFPIGIQERLSGEFDLNQFLVEKGGEKNRLRLQNESPSQSRANRNDFQGLKESVQNFFHEKIQDQNITEEERDERLRIQHSATIGDAEAMNMLVDEIATYLRYSSLQNIPYDPMFDSLAHALFEHIFRFKNFYKWQLHPESPSAKISGKEIWFKINGQFVKQEEEFESVKEVEQLIRLLQQSNKNFTINEQNPQGELDLEDGTRVTLTIPPRTLYPTIVFRRFIVNQFSFEEQASRGTIHPNDVPLFQTLAKVRRNTVIAGAVESGKSTMLKTFYAERPSGLVALMIEEHPETFLKRDFPDRLVHEFSIKDGDIQRVLRTVLRFDHDYVIMQEVRGVEADAAMDGASRGANGLLMTYHVTEPSKVCEQLAQHVLDAYPNRRYINEVRRVSQTLELGVTMKTFPGNKKRVTSVFEVNYDYDTDRAWISYLIRFNPIVGKWEYNDHISEKFQEQLLEIGKEEHDSFCQLLSERTAASTLSTEAVQPILFKDAGEGE